MSLRATLHGIIISVATENPAHPSDNPRGYLLTHLCLLPIPSPIAINLAPLTLLATNTFTRTPRAARGNTDTLNVELSYPLVLSVLSGDEMIPLIPASKEIPPFQNIPSEFISNGGPRQSLEPSKAHSQQKSFPLLQAPSHSRPSPAFEEYGHSWTAQQIIPDNPANHTNASLLPPNSPANHTNASLLPPDSPANHTNAFSDLNTDIGPHTHTDISEDTHLLTQLDASVARVHTRLTKARTQSVTALEERQEESHTTSAQRHVQPDSAPPALIPKNKEKAMATRRSPRLQDK